MSNMRLSIVNHWDVGTLAASSAVATLPVENTRVTDRGSPWRATDATAQLLTLTDADPRAANELAFFGHNLAGGTARLRLFSDVAMLTGVYDSGVLAIPAAAGATAGANYGLGGSASVAQALDDLFGNSAPYKLYFTAVAFKGAKLDLTAGAIATAAGFIECGPVWLGMYHESGINPEYGVALSWVSNTQLSRTMGGSLLANVGEIWPKLELNMSYIVDPDRKFWTDVQQYSQNARSVLVDMFPGSSDARLERDYFIHGQLVSLDPIIYGIAYRSKHVVVEGY